MYIDKIIDTYDLHKLEEKHIEKLSNIEYKSYRLISSMGFDIYYAPSYGYVLVDAERSNQVYNTFDEDEELDIHTIAFDNIRSLYEIIPEDYFSDYEYSLEKVFDDNFINMDREDEDYLSFYELDTRDDNLSNFTIIKEIQSDLVHMTRTSLTRDLYIAHCIGSDYMMAAGIAYSLDSKYDIKSQLRKNGNKLDYPNVYKTIHEKDNGGYLHIFNLVTKNRSCDIPTYDNFIKSLQKLNEELKKNGINSIFMPRIGCGIDRMDWNKVKCYLYKYLTYPENIYVYYI